MTSPAINVADSLVGLAHRWNTIAGVTSEVATAMRVWGTKRHFRPESKTSLPTASGFRYPTGWQHSKQDGLPAPSSYFEFLGIDSKNYQSFDSYALDGTVSSLPSFPSYLENRAVNQALGKIGNKGKDRVNLSVAFAERQETADLFAGNIKKIAKQVGRFRGGPAGKSLWGNVIKRGSLSEGYKVPQAWLELQYGWKPLLTDIFGALTALNQLESSQDAYRIGVNGKASESVSSTWQKRGTNGSNIFGYQVDRTIKQSCNVRLDCQMVTPLLATLAQLGITNPALLVWEKIPYSFVIDWALPVGDYLSLLDATFGWRFLSGSIGRISRLREYSPRPTQLSKVTNPAITYYGVSGGPFFNESFSMTREVYSSFPSPRIPSFKNPLSLDHVANALSLLVAAFR